MAVDIRKPSPTFCQWVGAALSADTKKQFWVPAGFAHGFLVLSDTAEFLYETTDYYAPEFKRCIAWYDLTIGIQWPILAAPVLSTKEQVGKSLAQAECFA